MQPVPPAERVHEAVARQLRDSILSGEYRPGERFPVERELSEQFQVSRSVVRLALLILDQQGLVRVRSGVGGGPFVTHEPLPAAIDAFENLLVVDSVSLADFIRAKLVLEPALNVEAARCISEADLAALEANIAETRQCLARGDGVAELMLKFHQILVSTISNRFVGLVAELMKGALDRLALPLDGELASQPELLAEHEQMLSALRRGDLQQVEQLTVSHLTHLWRHVLEADATGPDGPSAPSNWLPHSITSRS